MVYKDIVVIGASTGGIEALQVLVRGLSADYKGSIFVVLHTSSTSPNVLFRILDRAGPLPATNAVDWTEIKPGNIYVAPADFHLLLDKSGYMKLSRGPKENRFRPAVDPLFRSAAHAFGSRVVGVVLSGFLDDGTAGLWAVKAQGGTAIVQHPEEAIAAPMPLNALKHVEVDHCVRVEDIAPILLRLAKTPVDEKGVKPMTKELEAEVKIAREDKAINSGIIDWGEPSLFACPECHGVLMQLKEGSNVRFRCHTGHAYSVETLLTEFGEATEATLWNAIRSVEETSLLLQKMAEHLKHHKHTDAGDALLQRAQVTLQRADRIREILMLNGSHSEQDPSKEAVSSGQL